MSFRLLRHGSAVRVTIDADGARVEVLDGNAVPVRTPDGDDVFVAPGESIWVDAEH